MNAPDLFGHVRERSTLSIMHSAGARRDARDLYSDPVAATSALLEVERFPEPVLDPACGSGNVLTAPRRAGYRDVLGTDAADGARFDFLTMQVPARPASIVCNPPYRTADELCPIQRSACRRAPAPSPPASGERPDARNRTDRKTRPNGQGQVDPRRGAPNHHDT